MTMASKSRKPAGEETPRYSPEMRAHDRKPPEKRKKAWGDDYHLRRSPANVRRLDEAIAEVAAGKVAKRADLYRGDKLIRRGRARWT